jgi:hypothetical protein
VTTLIVVFLHALALSIPFFFLILAVVGVVNKVPTSTVDGG